MCILRSVKSICSLYVFALFFAVSCGMPQIPIDMGDRHDDEEKNPSSDSDYDNQYSSEDETPVEDDSEKDPYELREEDSNLLDEKVNFGGYYSVNNSFSGDKMELAFSKDGNHNTVELVIADEGFNTLNALYKYKLVIKSVFESYDGLGIEINMDLISVEVTAYTQGTLYDWNHDNDAKLDGVGETKEFTRSMLDPDGKGMYVLNLRKSSEGTFNAVIYSKALVEGTSTKYWTVFNGDENLKYNE